MEKQKTAITPAELKSRQFDKKMRGYDPEQVDDILQLAAEALEDTLVRIDSLSAEVKKLQEKVANCEKMESTIKDTLVATQSSVDEIKKNAMKEAELIKREAEVEAAREMELQQRKIDEIKSQIERLKSLRSDYLIKLKSLVGGHHEILGKLADEFEKPDTDPNDSMGF